MERTSDVIALAEYGGALSSALRRMKYGQRPDIAKSLGELLAAAVTHSLRGSDVDVVVPVPVPYARLVERGYNQAALLARPIATQLGVSFAPRALGRHGGGTKQAALGRAARLENLRGAFFTREPKRIAGARVLLVDDVCTTGATRVACETVLREFHAQSVSFAVVAIVPSPMTASTARAP